MVKMKRRLLFSVHLRLLALLSLMAGSILSCPHHISRRNASLYSHDDGNASYMLTELPPLDVNVNVAEAKCGTSLTDHHAILMAQVMDDFEKRMRGRELAHSTQIEVPTYWHIIRAQINGQVVGDITTNIIEAAMAQINKSWSKTGFRYILKGITRTTNNKWFAMENNDKVGTFTFTRLYTEQQHQSTHYLQSVPYNLILYLPIFRTGNDSSVALAIFTQAYPVPKRICYNDRRIVGVSIQTLSLE